MIGFFVGPGLIPSDLGQMEQARHFAVPWPADEGGHAGPGSPDAVQLMQVVVDFLFPAPCRQILQHPQDERPVHQCDGRPGRLDGAQVGQAGDLSQIAPHVEQVPGHQQIVLVQVGLGVPQRWLAVCLGRLAAAVPVYHAADVDEVI